MPLSRSEQMARIKGQNTRPETLLRSELWRRGLRYRLGARVPVGRPDLVFPGQRIAVFIDGCFWHGCPIHYVRPRSQASFWTDKLRANVERDRRHTLMLESHGWLVCRLWEHEITNDLALAADRIVAVVRGRVARRRPSWRVIQVDPVDSAAVVRDRERRHLVDLRDPGICRTVEGPRVGRSGKPMRRQRTPGVKSR